MYGSQLTYLEYFCKTTYLVRRFETDDLCYLVDCLLQYQSTVSTSPSEVLAATPEELSLVVEEGKGDGRPVVTSMPYVKGRLEKEGIIQPGMVRRNLFFVVFFALGRCGKGGGGGSEGEEGRTHFVAYLSHLTVDHASLSRRSRGGARGGGGTQFVHSRSRMAIVV